jgi:hypothetical protein
MGKGGKATMHEDRDQAQELPTDVPQEQALEQRPVPFLGDELAAALTTGGNIYISLPGMCTALYLNRQAQVRRITRTPALNKGLRRIPLATRGGPQLVYCLRVDRVALWLAGIETNSVNPTYRPKIEAYQEDLAPVAMQVFLRAAGISAQQLVPAGGDPQIAAIAEQIDTLSGVVTFLREHMEVLIAASGQTALRLDQAIALLEGLAERQSTTERQVAQLDVRTDHLTPAHALQVQDVVNRLVRETKRLPSPLTHAIIYGRIRHSFRVNSYTEIRDGQIEDLMAWLRDELARATSGEAPQQGGLF